MSKFIKEQNGWTEEDVEYFEKLQRILNDEPIEPGLPQDDNNLPCDPNPVVGRCSKCGIQLHQVMGYVCSQPHCPTSLGSPFC